MKDNLLREFCILAYPLYTAHNFTCFDCKKITTQEDIVKSFKDILRKQNEVCDLSESIDKKTGS